MSQIEIKNADGVPVLEVKIGENGVSVEQSKDAKTTVIFDKKNANVEVTEVGNVSIVNIGDVKMTDEI